MYGNADPIDPYPVEDDRSAGSYASTGAGSSSGGTTDAAKEQGGRLASEAAGGGQHVAHVAKEQASSVASEAGAQARNLLGEAKSQLSSQASDQKGSLVSYLKSFGDDLDGMVSGRQQDSDSGPARDLARRASGYASNAASWLDDREPSQILDEVSRFARRRPGLFLIFAAAAGVLAGRLTRGLTGGSDDGDMGSSGQSGYSMSGQGRALSEPLPASTSGYAVEEEYPVSGYGTSGYANSTDTPGAGAAGYDVEEVVYPEEEFGLPDTDTGRRTAPGEPGYDDRGLR